MKPEVMFKKWTTYLLTLMLRTNERRAVNQLWSEVIENPPIENAMIQAFTNLKWDLDEIAENMYVNTLREVVSIAQAVADPEDENTQKIVGAIEEMISAEEQDIEELSEEEINEINS